MKLGFGIAAGLDRDVAREIGALCQELGYASLWSNDHPAASGLETLTALGDSAPELELGVGALALDRHSPAEIAAKVEELSIEPQRLWLAIGAGFSPRPLGAVRSGIEELRVLLPSGVRIAAAAMGPMMCALAGEIADGAFLNWMTPERAKWAQARIADGARSAGRDVPNIFGYVRVAVDGRATDRLIKEEGFYRELHDGYRKHFAELGTKLGSVGVASNDPEEVVKGLRSYDDSHDHVVVRALASANFDSMATVARVAAPTMETARVTSPQR